MNTFIYEDNLGSDWDIWYMCYPIHTEKTLDELVNFLQEQAETFVEYSMEEHGEYEREFNPWGEEYDEKPFNSNYLVSTNSCLDGSIRRKFILLKDWKGVTL